MGTGRSSQTQTATIPDELKPLINASVLQAMGLQEAMPITGFSEPHPQTVPGLTPQQEALIGQTIGFSQAPPGSWLDQQAFNMANQAGSSNPFQGQAMGFAGQAASGNQYQGQSSSMATGAGNLMGPEQEAMAGLGLFSQGQLGQAPATIAAQQAFQQFEVPTIEQNLALAGLGRSGAVGTAIAEGEARALVPFLTAEMMNRLQAAQTQAGIGSAQGNRQVQGAGVLSQLAQNATQGQLGAAQVAATLGGQAIQGQLGGAQLIQGLATTLANRARSDTQAALEAAGIPRQVAAQQAEAEFNDFMRRQQLSASATLGPLDQTLPLMMGRTVSTSGSGGMFGK